MIVLFYAGGHNQVQNGVVFYIMGKLIENKLEPEIKNKTFQ